MGPNRTSVNIFEDRRTPPHRLLNSTRGPCVAGDAEPTGGVFFLEPFVSYILTIKLLLSPPCVHCRPSLCERGPRSILERPPNAAQCPLPRCMLMYAAFPDGVAFAVGWQRIFSLIFKAEPSVT
jgi:hypothetical protein